MGAVDDIPAYALALAARPSSHNGLHLLNPTLSAIPAACVPLMKSIAFATIGITASETIHKLPPSISCVYRNWHTSPHPEFRVLARHGPTIIALTTGVFSCP